MGLTDVDSWSKKCNKREEEQEERKRKRETKSFLAFPFKFFYWVTEIGGILAL